MKRFTITQMLLVLTWIGVAFALLSHHWRTIPYLGRLDEGWVVEFDDLATKTHVTITEEMIAASASWNPSMDNPPVTARDALRAADSFRKTNLTELGHYQWGLVSVSLVPLDGENGKWCWMVLFEAGVKPGRGSSGPPNEYVAYVMMDGTVVGMAETEYSEFDRLMRLGLIPDPEFDQGEPEY